MITLKNLQCKNENIDIDKYIDFIENVRNDMQFPEWLADFTRPELENLLANNSKIWIYSKDSIPVCSMMLIPATEKILNEYGMDLNPNEVMDYGPMFVDPMYTGNGLQLQMLRKLDLYVPSIGYKYGIYTLHPDNIYSLVNVEKDDFVLKKTKLLNRGLRNIYLKEYYKK